MAIGIIGGGVSGLAALKQLAHHDPILFEASDSIGGVWRSCCYHSTKLQSRSGDYEFTDFPWPKPVANGISNDDDDPISSFPSHIEILDYLQDYAQHFDLLKHVRFNSKVVELRFVGEGGGLDDHFYGNFQDYGSLLPGRPVWEVAVQINNQPETIQWYAFEFLILCTGKYGDIPNIPEFPHDKSPEIFNGKVLHTLDYCKLGKEAAFRLLNGKKVAIVGFKKSAIDLALECVDANQGPEGQPCTIVVRTLRWPLPHNGAWGLPFFMFFSTRFSQMIQERPNQSFLSTILCSILSPMRRVVSKFIESYLLYKLPLQKYGLKPNHPFIDDYASCQTAILPDNFFPEVDKGNILFKKTKKWWFTSAGIEFEDDTKLEVDVVILATGYDGSKKLKNILPEPFRSLLEFPYGVMPLYRGTIHPLIPNMGFVGYLESGSNLHMAELRCIWLARLLDSKFNLPTVEKMLQQVTEEMEIMKRTSRFYKRQCLSTFSINHRDEICDEMGWKPWRKKNLLAEAFSPYGGHDYKQE